MKLLPTILLCFVGFIILGQLFIWFLALGSGHNLPKDTQTAFSRNLVILIIALILLVLWRRKVNQ